MARHTDAAYTSPRHRWHSPCWHWPAVAEPPQRSVLTGQSIVLAGFCAVGVRRTPECTRRAHFARALGATGLMIKPRRMWSVHSVRWWRRQYIGLRSALLCSAPDDRGRRLKSCRAKRRRCRRKTRRRCTRASGECTAAFPAVILRSTSATIAGRHNERQTAGELRQTLRSFVPHRL